MCKIEQLNRDMAAFFADEARPLVFGEGKTDSPALMLVGEAPGGEEELQRRPFVGRAGKNLDEFLRLVSLDRREIYVSNVVKVRPTAEGKKGRLRNRAPSRGELARFAPWLEREIISVRPKLLVSLGNVPLHALAGDKDITVGQAHGTFVASRAGLPLFALYHPASVIYRQALRAVYVQDVMRLADALGKQTLHPLP